MSGNLALGTAIISTTVLIHTLGLIGVTRLMNYVRAWFRLHRHEAGRTAAMLATVLALFIGRFPRILRRIFPASIERFRSHGRVRWREERAPRPPLAPRS